MSRSPLVFTGLNRQIRVMRKLVIAAALLGLLSAVAVRADGSPDKIPYSSLTPEERDVLARGEVSTGAYVGGAITGTLVGLGIGTAIQGRYFPYGVVFTVGEVATASVYAWAAADCIDQTIALVFFLDTNAHCHEGALVASAIGYMGLRVWEIIDNWALPPSENARYRELRQRVDGAPKTQAEWVIIPAVAERGTVHKVDGAGLGLQLRF
jgi:hypothetical protein